MKKIIIISILSILIFFFLSKTIFSRLFIISFSKWLERDLLIKKIDINYSNQEIILNYVEILNDNEFFYKNVFEADKIKIKYNFKSLFTNLVQIDYVILKNAKLYLEFHDKKDNIVDDNVGLAKKNNSNYKPKVYPKKKKDKNFLVFETELKNLKAFIKTVNNKKKMEVDLSDMIFYKVSNKPEFQHFKEVFKIILNDLFFKIPDQDLKNLIKKTYNF